MRNVYVTRVTAKFILTFDIPRELLRERKSLRGNDLKFKRIIADTSSWRKIMSNVNLQV